MKVTGAIRRISRAHGVLVSTLATWYDGSSLSSCSVILGWSAGLSRKYQTQATTQMVLTTPTMKKDSRHPHQAMKRAKTTGAAALPSREKEWVMPWPKARRSSGSHLAMACVAVGKDAP